MTISCDTKWCIAGLAVMVALAVFALYAPSLGYDYAGLDDDMFVVENPLVKDGFSRTALQGAFTTAPEAYWAPLLWMSYMLDVECFGLRPFGFHLGNVALFAANAGLLFWLVRRWTGRTGLALATALLWAFHPARVESVAWITERKDVLSGLFFLLGVGAYVEGRRGHIKAGTWVAWGCMLLGGMAKQIIIVMPVALLLLDVWPLGRTDWNRIWRDGWRLAAEKWAFWLVALALACVPIWFHQLRGGLVEVSFARRLAMIPIHYLFYLAKLLWPTRLMPLQADLRFGWGVLALSLGVLLGVTWALWRRGARQPWALMGWLWFVGLLFPVSGVFWPGQERVATRFLYLPQMGLTLAVVLAADWIIRGRGWPTRRSALVCALVLAAYAGQSLYLLPHWRDRATFGKWVWRYHPGHGTACMLGGEAFMTEGNWAQAEEAYARGVVLQSRDCMSRLCRLRNLCGQTEWAEKIWDTFEKVTGKPVMQFDKPIETKELKTLWDVRGQMLRAKGNYEGAIAALREAVALEKDPAAFTVAEFMRACHEAGRPAEAAQAAARLEAAKGTAIRSWEDLHPRYLQLWLEGGRGQAYIYFLEYAKRNPRDGIALNNMAWALATAEPDGMNHARMEEWPATALQWLEQVMALGGGQIAGAWDTLGAARANNGDFPGAITAAEKALRLARAAGDRNLVDQVEARLAAYRVGKPWREKDRRAAMSRKE